MLLSIKMKYPSIASKKYLLTLSLPIFFSNLAIPLVGLVDTGLMGHLNNEKFLAAISIATAVITMIFWSFGFLRMGTVGLVSQSLGKGDYREIVLITLRNLYLALIFGFIIICSKTLILFAIENFFSPSNETLLLIEKYISIRIFSAPAELSMYVLTGLFIGLQKTKISSGIALFFSLINIFLSIYFVKYLDYEISGVALGTLVSSYLTIVIFSIYSYFYARKSLNVIPRLQKILNRKKMFKLLNINFNIFIRTILLTFTFLYFTFQSSQLGEDYLAINSILIQFILISSFVLDSYAFSTEGVVGYSIARGVKKSFLITVSNSFKLSFITSLILSFLFLLFYKNLINSLTDLEFLRYLSYNFAIWIILIPPVASFCYQYDGIFIGTSHSEELRNSMIISVFIFIILSSVLRHEYGNHGLWFSMLIFMFLRTLTLKFFFKNILNKF